MVSEKLYDEVSQLLTEDEFKSVYKHATTGPHNCLYIDTHPNTHKVTMIKDREEISIWYYP